MIFKHTLLQVYVKHNLQMLIEEYNLCIYSWIFYMTAQLANLVGALFFSALDCTGSMINLQVKYSCQTSCEDAAVS